MRELDRASGARSPLSSCSGAAGAPRRSAGSSDVDLLDCLARDRQRALDRLIPITDAHLLDSGIDVSVHPMTPETYDSIRRMHTGFYDNVDREGILVG